MAPTRILLRAGRPPHDTSSNEAAFAFGAAGHYASNTGNMLYSDAVGVTLRTPGTTVVTDGFLTQQRVLADEEIARLDDEFDVFVCPLANAFRPGFAGRQLELLTDFVSRTSLPVVVPGVGGQAGLDGDPTDLPERELANTTAFVRAVLEKGPSIGVRGEITRSMLLRLGFPDDAIDVIGCPSMYVNGRDFQVVRRVDGLHRSSPLAVNLEVGAEGEDGDVAALWAVNEAAYDDLVAVYQRTSGGALVMWGVEGDDIPVGTPRTTADPAFVEGRLRFFTNPRPWRDFMAQRDFAFGVRIHGNVAALTAGTPAFLLTVDTRTAELADIHAIPHASLSSTVQSGGLLAEDLYERADPSPVNRAMPENFDRWTRFLERHGLEHVHQPGRANPAYADELARAPMPAGAAPATPDSPAEVAARLRWLWEDHATDRRRDGGRTEQELELADPEPDQLHAQVHALTRRLNRLERRHDRQVARLRARIRELELAPVAASDDAPPGGQLLRGAARRLRRRVTR